MFRKNSVVLGVIKPETLVIVRVHYSFYFIVMEYQGYFGTTTDLFVLINLKRF